jgi:hypothetical protein
MEMAKAPRLNDATPVAYPRVAVKVNKGFVTACPVLKSRLSQSR